MNTLSEMLNQYRAGDREFPTYAELVAIAAAPLSAVPEQALLRKDAKRFADAFADGWVPLLQEDTNRVVAILRMLTTVPAVEEPA